ncbi:hypothetical protein GCM10011506_26340 [Marivirga lumbricoides]|uniref:Uncharacterized protein n=1 Tax=Marivirga lumbricoides TaxID=1046115 RepID=A0A2T4DRJ7_9BACT|nr:hypothetical protein C9994_07390 [Marivirga lumbricoides]GGC39580.1 hypothetical protein GCM10011506_26340 [Marivirga lumbricoides]
MSRKKKGDSDKKKQEPTVNPELKGFDVKIDTFGEIKTSFDIDRINAFLNKEVEDKKLKNREDLDFIKKKKNINKDEEE